MQRGQIFKRNGAWHLRFRRDEIIDGKPVRARVSQRLAPINDQYRKETDLWDLAAAILAPVNRGTAPEAGLTIEEFTTKFFLPYIAAKKKPSTAKFYREVFNNHLRDRVGNIRLRDFTTRHAQEVLDAIPLTHQSLLRIKTGMSAIFSYAIRLGYIQGANAVREAKAEGKRSEPKQYAYSMDEVEYMLANLKEPARTVVAVAAFTGLRESEIRGLQWADYVGTELYVRRSLWRTHIGETKTDESKGGVPVIAPLRKILDQHKRQNGSGTWIFAGEKKGFALHLDNLCRRDMKPILGERWHGWHAFRRGLTTNLYDLGVPPETAQVLLRHADASTTRKHYLVLKSSKQGAAAMRKLEKAVDKWATNGQHAKPRKSRQPA